MDDALLGRMQELRDLCAVINLATWDQETYLPRRAEGARASQLGTLQALYHERLVDPRLGDWLDGAKGAGDEAAMVRVLRRERDRAVRLPARLVRELAEAQSHALAAWREAREQKVVRPFLPHLEKLVRLRREQADAWGHGGERYDALLEAYEPGMRVARLGPVLASLTAALVPLVEALDARPKPKDVFAGQRFAPEAQWPVTLELLRAMGFDLDAGRQDKSVHPFTCGLDATDVRLTTRFDEGTPMPALSGTIHEAGHGLYEQGFAPEHSRTTLAQAPSMGLHESQSRLWENVVGRSRPFWAHFLPRLARAFPAELGGVGLDDFYAAINRVQRTFIRVEADEVTYNLHIALRYELEVGLLRGELAVADAEAAWNAKTKSLLGLDVASPLAGVLQDIHWAWGEFGYFPTYALGNLYAASLFAALRKELPDVDERLARGELLPVRDWLRAKVHREGYRHEAEDLVKRVTGRGLTDEDFLAYLNAKYGALYGLPG